MSLQHLVKNYGRLAAVNDVSLSIHEGEIFGSIGPNGAGKTTAVECISRLRAPDSGSISVYGLLRSRTETRSESLSVSSCRRARNLHGSWSGTYIHGVSTRAVDNLAGALGIKKSISKDQVSRICKELVAQVHAFRTRRLDGEHPYLFLVATFEKWSCSNHHKEDHDDG